MVLVFSDPAIKVYLPINMPFSIQEQISSQRSQAENYSPARWTESGINPKAVIKGRSLEIFKTSDRPPSFESPLKIPR